MNKVDKIRSQYQQKVKISAAGQHIFRDCLRAFWVGGAICAFGEALNAFYRFLGADVERSGLFSSVSLIFLACFFTAIGWFDEAARYAGAGTLVPITGFANAIASPAIDAKREGLVTGMGAKLFLVAGPVILYGTSLSVLYGLILYLLRLFGADLPEV